jgi:long-chain acyl-CoA synthetase
MVNYAERPWIQHYDPGVPGTLMPYPQKPIYSYLRDSAQKHPNRPALITSAKLPVVGRQAANLTYSELDRASDALACALVAMGLQKGERVAIIMPNVAAFAIAYYGILKAGGVVVACNPTYPAEKMAFQINDSGATMVISLSLFYNLMKSIQARTQVKRVIVTSVKEYFPVAARLLFTLAREKKDGHYIGALQDRDVWLQDLLLKYDGQKPNVDVKADDLAIYQYTGGTTGISKGAMATHQALVCNTMQTQAWTFSTTDPDIRKLFEHVIFLGAIPLFHVYGMVALLGTSVTLSGTVALVINARDLNDVVDTIAFVKPNVFTGVPALFNAINNHPRIKSGEVSLKSIRLSSSGSAPLPPATKSEFEALISGTLVEGFGMSEAPTVSHCNPLSGENRTGSVGLPMPDMDMRIVSLDDDEMDVPVGEVGELVMTGPNLMLGYHNMPTETAKTIRERNGKRWLYTGDIARMDKDGYFYIVDRKKDMALIGGFNVYPNNIEKVLKDHPAVLEVGVAAVPHPDKSKAGQDTLKAWVVLKPGMNATEQELSKHCEQYLAAYEVPRRFAFIAELPKTTVGKTLRRELVRLEVEGQES